MSGQSRVQPHLQQRPVVLIHKQHLGLVTVGGKRINLGVIHTKERAFLCPYDWHVHLKLQLRLLMLGVVVRKGQRAEVVDTPNGLLHTNALQWYHSMIMLHKALV